MWDIRHFRGYLEDYEFSVVINHQALRWLQKLELPTERLGRWMLEFQQYSYIKYRRGKQQDSRCLLATRPRYALFTTRAARGIIDNSVEFTKNQMNI